MRRRKACVICWFVLGVAWGWLPALETVARAQAPAAAPPPAPGLPMAGSPPPSSPPPIPVATVEELAGRLRAMEARNRELSERLERNERTHQQELRTLLERVDQLSARLTGTAPAPTTATPSARAPTTAPLSTNAPTPTSPAETPPRRWLGGPEPEYSGPVPEYETQPIEPNPFRSPPRPGPSTIISPERRPLESNFGPGFQIQSLDEEFQLQVHIQEQVEARIWGDANGTPFKSGFYLPRQRIFFNGRITRPVEYVFSINRGFGDLNILETFINFHPTDKFMVRFGRYFTPLGYDQFAVRNLWLPTPERSLFTTNLGPNRQVGVMAWGYLLDKRLDYAAGIFSGPRNSFEDRNNAKDFTGFVNARPFQDSDAPPFLRDLNLGTSVAYGRQDQPAVPLAFRVGAVAPTNSDSAALASAPFLTLNPDVLERGPRLLGSVHAAHFHKGLSLIGEWQYGYGTYASPAARSTARVPFSGYYVTAAYFLTGEHVDRRAMVVPRRPVFPTLAGQRAGFGAWEAVARVSRLGLGDEVFTAGLADKNVWSNSVFTTELGLNWYWNEHTKIYLFWLHGAFGEPVMYGLGDTRDSVDMFWMRFQLFF